jgi:hypothetical protein
LVVGAARGTLSARGTEAVKGQVLTQYSSHANVIADTFRAAFTKTTVGDHAVEMTAPTDSTKGGLLALQHVLLKPPSGAALVVGTVNAGEKRSELRSHAYLARLSDERFKRPLSFDEPAYSAFLEKAESVLGAFGIEVVLSDPPPEPLRSSVEEEAAPPSRPARLVPIVVALLIVLVVSGGVWLALHR